MAIHSTADDGPSPDHPQQAAPPHPIDIEAWTEQATAAMSAVTIAAPAAGGESIQTATVTLSIPLDDEHHDPAPRSTPAAAASAPKATATATGDAGYYKRKEPLRRDSMKRRDALLKGKEGSRRRQRWENDHLLTNPHLTPPSPHDWEIHPTYPTTHVPYYLAPLWDAGLARQSAARRAAKSKVTSRTVQTAPSAPGIVPRELRERLKKARGAKGLLRDLEGEVRAFVEVWEERGRVAERDGLPVDPDSSDDEIVFVGRNGRMREDGDAGGAERELKLFETPVSDQTGTFGRWLVHHIGTYYGLRTWSVTKGDPARREAYVGIADGKVRAKTGREFGSGAGCGLPRPLYGLV